MNQQHTITEMQEIAKSRDGECLSEKYISTKIPLRWKCAKGHEWETMPRCILAGSWCKKCSGKEALTIEEMQKNAAAKNGKCLSVEYINNLTDMRWECQKGHQWTAKPLTIRQGYWCPFCAGCAKLTLADAKKMADERGFVLLSSVYYNSRTKLQWQCKKGHIWYIALSQLKGCPYCARVARLTIRELQDVAQKRSGKLLSQQYTNSNVHLEWQCENGHTWHAAARTILHGNHGRGSWCPFCVGKKKEMQEIVDFLRDNHLKMLSEYQNSTKKTKFECLNCNGVWFSTWNRVQQQIRRGASCPLCRAIKGRVLRPRKNYNAREIAKDWDGILISPECPGGAIGMWWECKNKHRFFATPRHARKQWCPFCRGTRLSIEDFQNVAKSRGGECLSSQYGGQKKKLVFVCKNGHQWSAWPSHIIKQKRYSWCPHCSLMSKRTIEEMRDVAQQRGGLCLSNEYKSLMDKLLWQCKYGHTWTASGGHVIYMGSWCPECHRLALIKDDKFGVIPENFVYETYHSEGHGKRKRMKP